MSNTTIGRQQSQGMVKQLLVFLGPLEQWLDDQIDRRLVRTFFLTLQVIVRLRHSRSGLLLSELGAHVLSPSRAPAGIKRLSNLWSLRSTHFSSLYWPKTASPWSKTCFEPGATEQESGTAKPRYRFLESVPL